MNTATFLSQLQQQAQAQEILVRSEFLAQDPAMLNVKPHATGWSILECLEHLNRYSRFYLPHVERALAATATPLAPQPVRYSWMGKKSIDLVNPANAKKHKTLKHMNPHNSQLTAAVLEEFLQHQSKLMQFLENAAKADLNQKAIPVEFFRLLKMRLGEALEFLLLHQQRHLQQALRVKEQLRQPISLVV
ncbi:DinB family protein [Rufibacter latericius]|uniref:DinB family protein n=1 Tax=Rufibacter latericius TaxID=2487040 RepID=A0A3M9MD47_9BACT|nr:DinB family protein [Rufibacter latericius]RNI23500.1 DinB family protein [Rufibacter latericius]